MSRTHAICILALLSVLAIASKVHAQAVLNPNQISGTVQFTNQNPEILDILSPTGLNQGLTAAYISAVSIGISPPLSLLLLPPRDHPP